MNLVTITLLGVLLLLVLAGVAAAAVDLSKLGAQALDRRRARRACNGGWDWPTFERDLASYAARRHGQRPAAHRRR